jgi:hypothetical protein
MRTEAVKYCAGIPAILVVALSACTAVKVRPIEDRSKMANVCIERNPAVQVGYGEFHLRGGGGYSMFKWQGTKAKMDPVIDRLFADQALQ